jgi:hypothetical protein
MIQICILEARNLLSRLQRTPCPHPPPRFQLSVEHHACMCRLLQQQDALVKCVPPVRRPSFPSGPVLRAERECLAVGVQWEPRRPSQKDGADRWWGRLTGPGRFPSRPRPHQLTRPPRSRRVSSLATRGGSARAPAHVHGGGAAPREERTALSRRLAAWAGSSMVWE